MDTRYEATLRIAAKTKPLSAEVGTPWRIEVHLPENGLDRWKGQWRGLMEGVNGGRTIALNNG